MTVRSRRRLVLLSALAALACLARPIGAGALNEIFEDVGLIAPRAAASELAALQASGAYQSARAAILALMARASELPPELVRIVRPPRIAGLPPRSAYIETESVTDSQFRQLLLDMRNRQLPRDTVPASDVPPAPPDVVPVPDVAPLPIEVESTLNRFGLYLKTAKGLSQQPPDPRPLVGAQGSTAQWAGAAITVQLNYAQKYTADGTGGDLMTLEPVLRPCDPATVPVGYFCAFYFRRGNIDNPPDGSSVCGDSSCFQLTLPCTNKPNYTEYISSGCYQAPMPGGGSSYDWVCSDNCQWACASGYAMTPQNDSCCTAGCGQAQWVSGCDPGLSLLEVSSGLAYVVPQLNFGACVDCAFARGTRVSFAADPVTNPCGFICLPGYYSTIPASNYPCAACPAGQYGQVTDAGGAVVDPVSATGDWLGACAACPPGKYTPFDGYSVCLTCGPGGYVAGSGQRSCQWCVPGTYSSAQSATACLECPGGSFQGGYAASSCQACASVPSVEPGSVSCPPAGSSPLRSKLPVSSCPGGQYIDVSLGSGCLTCADGTYSTGSGVDNLAWDRYPTYVNTLPLQNMDPSLCGSAQLDGVGGYCTGDWGGSASSTIRVTGGQPVIGVVTQPQSGGVRYLSDFTMQRDGAPGASGVEARVLAGGTDTVVNLLPPTYSSYVTLTRSPASLAWVVDYVAFRWSVLYSIPPCRPCPNGTFSSPDHTACLTPTQLCGAGYYVQTAVIDQGWSYQTCQGCRLACPQGQYKTADCSGTADLQCAPCAAACAAGQYMLSACTPSSPVQCGECDGCRAGTFQVGGCDGVHMAGCQSCRSCPAGYYFAEGSCNGTLDSVCRACDSCVAGASYEVRACAGGLNRACAACAACPAGTYQTTPCTLTAAPVCQSCTPCNVAGQMLFSNPRWRFPIGQLIQQQYETAPCGGPLGDRQCANCRVCLAGQYASRVCNGTQNTVCSDCTATCPGKLQLVQVCVDGLTNNYCGNFSAGCATAADG